ncbi:MAG: response regulator transcription factor [Melioribacteraceae bacterium]
MKQNIKILVADDHPLMRAGLVMVLEEENNCCQIEQAKDGEEAYNKLVSNKFDVVTLDIEMPKMSGLEIARKLTEEKIETKIIFLTMYKDEDMFNEAMDTGANGFVLKENAVTDILDGIKVVMQNGYYISPLISEYLIKRGNRLNNLVSETPSIKLLTKSERKILKLISEDKTSIQISEELFVSSKTVNNHRSNISKKLNLHGTHSLVKFAIRNKKLL